MNNKTLLYIGIAAAAYYLYAKSKKAPILTQKAIYTLNQIKALSDANLLSLIQDLTANPNNYSDPANYMIAAKAEQQNRINAGKGPTTGGGVVFSV
jgi:hypothetical protein